MIVEKGVQLNTKSVKASLSPTDALFVTLGKV
jgi:hypothetical protein